MKTSIAFLALSICAAAQTASKVTLSGPLNDLTITNNSDRPVIAAMVLYFGADGKERAGAERMFILDRPNYLAIGDSEKMQTFTKGKGAEGVVSARVAAVIFSDGEFLGGDDRESSNFRQNMEERFQAMRAVFQLAKSGEWDKIKALYDADANGDLWKAAVSSRLLRVHDKGGDINSLKHYGNLPASTWKGNLLNIRRTNEAA